MDYVKDLFVDYTGGSYITGDSPNIDGNSDGYLIRLNSDGTLDNSFGMLLFYFYHFYICYIFYFK